MAYREHFLARRARMVGRVCVKGKCEGGGGGGGGEGGGGGVCTVLPV